MIFNAYKKIYFLLLISLSILGSSFSQTDLSTHFMQSLVQSSYSNPALIPEGLNVALPGGYIDFYNSTGSIGNLIEDVDGKKVLSLGLLDLSKLDNQEFINFQGALEPLTLTYLKNKLSLGFQYQIAGSGLFLYDKTIPEILLEGNSQYIGETVDLNIDLFSSLQHIYGFSIGYHLPYFAIAARLKYYSGIFNLETENGSATLTTEEDTYRLNFNSNYSFLKSGDLLQLMESELALNGDRLFRSFISKSFGLGADIGIKLNLSDQFNVNASILDLGAIRWRKEPENWTTNSSVSIEGVDLTGILEDQSIDFQDLTDTLESFLDITSASTENYRSALPTKIFLGFQYDMNETLTIGLLYADEFNERKIFPTIAAQVTAHIGDVFHIGSVYSTKQGSFTNLGLHMLLQLGPVQLYGLTDNLFDIIQFKPYSNMHVRAGINLQFKFDQ